MLRFDQMPERLRHGPLDRGKPVRILAEQDEFATADDRIELLQVVGRKRRVGECCISRSEQDSRRSQRRNHLRPHRHFPPSPSAKIFWITVSSIMSVAVLWPRGPVVLTARR